MMSMQALSGMSEQKKSEMMNTYAEMVSKGMHARGTGPNASLFEEDKKAS